RGERAEVFVRLDDEAVVGLFGKLFRGGDDSSVSRGKTTPPGLRSGLGSRFPASVFEGVRISFVGLMRGGPGGFTRLASRGGWRHALQLLHQLLHRPLPSSADDIRTNQQPDTNRTRMPSRRLNSLIRPTIFHSSALIPKPYKGNGQAIGDLIGGHVSMMVLSLSTILGNVKTGKLFALAVTTPDRSKLLPDVPTIAESAVPGFCAAIR